MKNKIKPLILLTLLAGCGPQFQTFYDYTPPKSATGKQCITTCRLVLETCKGNVNNSYQACLTRSSNEQRACESNRRYEWNKKSKDYECVYNCYCSGEYCPDPDFSECEEDYRICYQDCGGRVVGSSRCVANCDQVKD